MRLLANWSVPCAASAQRGGGNNGVTFIVDDDFFFFDLHSFVDQHIKEFVHWSGDQHHQCVFLFPVNLCILEQFYFGAKMARSASLHPPMSSASIVLSNAVVFFLFFQLALL